MTAIGPRREKKRLFRRQADRVFGVQRRATAERLLVVGVSLTLVGALCLLAGGSELTRAPGQRVTHEWLDDRGLSVDLAAGHRQPLPVEGHMADAPARGPRQQQAGMRQVLADIATTQYWASHRLPEPPSNSGPR